MTIKAKLIGAFAVSAISLVVVCVIYQQSLGRLLEARRWVEHTQTVLERLESILSLCKDLETGARGFNLTRQDVFLEPFTRARGKLGPMTAQLRTLTGDNSNQQRRVDRLEDLETANIAFGEKIIQLTRTQDIKAATDVTATQQGKKLMDELRALVGEMEDEEKSLLQKRTADADQLLTITSIATISGASLSILLTLLAAFATISSFGKSVRSLQNGLDKIGAGNLDHRITSDSSDEFSRLGASFNDMASKLMFSIEESASRAWLNKALARLGQSLQGERDSHSAAQKVLSEFADAIGSRHGMFYSLDSGTGASDFSLLASYAHHERKTLSNSFALGQGLIGQCALEKQKIVVDDLPDNFVRISSGVGEASPAATVVIPVMFENKVKAVIEQASLKPLNSMQFEYLDQAANNLGVILNSVEAAQQTEKLLRQEQTLTEELQAQQEELTETNRRLESLANSLQASEEELRQQQEELQQTNEELEERSRAQVTQNAELETKNTELERLRQSMQEKAQQLSVTSKYKSQFLSNMSHELRTPLNSLLILSKVLFENADGNLMPKQVEFARTIHSAGSDLLVLIDDVLDISKIEAGAMPIDVAVESIRDLCTALLANFQATAAEKGLIFSVEIEPDVPRFLKTDGRRLQQILKNLVSNAIKFTERGSVTLNVAIASSGWRNDSRILSRSQQVIGFTVIDTGIGIAIDQQDIVFEAFQQGDGTTNRRFGGSGLGLAISRELAALLGGELKLRSEPGSGSSFSLYLPTEYVGPEERDPAGRAHALWHETDREEVLNLAANSIDQNNGMDDRAVITSGDRVLLLVQEDSELSQTVIARAHAKAFKVICATQGKAGFALVQRFKPDAIIINANLPDRDGWTLLDRLKRDSSTRHIPVHVIADGSHAARARRLGALSTSDGLSSQTVASIIDHMEAFAAGHTRSLLIVEDNVDEREQIAKLVEGADVEIANASTGQQALELLAARKFDCMILDLGLPDITGFELLDNVARRPELSEMRIIINTSRALTPDEELALKRNSQSIVIKGAKSDERLLDETMLFLHRIETTLPDEKRKILERLHLKDSLLSARRVLIVDDDMRHIFAITSLLEQYGMQPLYAVNGKQALDILSKDPPVDMVLMDVMMPDMDGHETMRAIRGLQRYQHVPIIALTAKAMKGDREQCIDSGASDYLSKPVDSDQLLSLMRVWLY